MHCVRQIPAQVVTKMGEKQMRISYDFVCDVNGGETTPYTSEIVDVWFDEDGMGITDAESSMDMYCKDITKEKFEEIRRALLVDGYADLSGYKFYEDDDDDNEGSEDTEGCGTGGTGDTGNADGTDNADNTSSIDSLLDYDRSFNRYYVDDSGKIRSYDAETEKHRSFGKRVKDVFLAASAIVILAVSFILSTM
jgi:hypothetical protein